MNSGPTSDAHLENALHNNADAYWCPRCWAFTLDCSHLVSPLTTKHVVVKDWQYRYVAYDRNRKLLELGLNSDEAYQHRGVPLEVAVGMVEAKSPAEFCKERIDGKFPFERVRVLHRFLLMLANEVEELLAT